MAAGTRRTVVAVGTRNIARKAELHTEARLSRQVVWKSDGVSVRATPAPVGREEIRTLPRRCSLARRLLKT
jgi:hypothetical protein